MLTPAAKKKIQGKLPMKREVVDWGETKVLQSLKFMNFFTEGENFTFTKEKIANAANADESFWEEFLIRLDAENNTIKQFRYRFMTFSRVILAWLKSNPHAITAEMWAVMKDHPRMQWAVSNFKEVTNEMGATVVEIEHDETTDPMVKNASPSQTQAKNPQVVYNQSLLTMATLFQDLLKGVSRSEIKEMKAEKRIDLANKLANTLAKSFASYRPNTAVFQNINIHKGSREELEQANLQYAQAQREE